MRCEVVAIGTELLLGQIVDTNSSWIGEQLAMAGIDSHFQTKVGDNLDRMTEVLEIALGRSDAVIVCGGLGPTQDDITRDAIASVMGVGLERDDSVVERIRAMFSSRGREMPANNLRQADVPVGATTIPRQPGTAPGLVCPMPDGKVVYAVPGVPWEMQEMVGSFVLDDLRHRSGSSDVIRSRTLRTWGHSESGLAELLAAEVDRLDEIGNPTLAFLASGIEGIKVRLTAKGASETVVNDVLADQEERVRAILGRDLVFGVDDETMESVVLDRLAAVEWTLAVAEVVSGGLMAARLSPLRAADGVFIGGFAASSPAGLAPMLGLDAGSLSGHDSAARAALEVASCTGATTSVAVLPGDPNEPGAIRYATAVEGVVEDREIRLPGDRARAQQFSVITALNALRQRMV